MRKSTHKQPPWTEESKRTGIKPGKSLSDIRRKMGITRTMNGEAIAWEATLDDGRFRARVIQGNDGYHGTLQVTVEETGEEILRQEVGIAYAARFGPDMDDVADWEIKTTEAVDAWIARQDS